VTLKSSTLVALGSVLSLLLLTSGCATSRGILTVGVPSAPNPTSGIAYKIENVTDQREFELKPAQASIPSLKNGEIQDRAITSRAIARKRNTWGKALGDILLPEGRTVQDLTSEAIERAFREAGLRVVLEGEPGWATAKPVEAEIQQLWAWVTPGFWALTMQFEMRARIKTDLGQFRQSEEAHGTIRLKSQGAGTRQWRNTITRGLEQFNSDLKDKLLLATREG
jgi:hypothetical protein